MKEVVIISGKGGTGKTSLTASFAVLEAGNTVVADCDVDAADLHLLLGPEVMQTDDFYSGKMAVIDGYKCTNCGLCAERCRFDALRFVRGQYRVDLLNCEGCGYCSLVCPEHAITMEEQNVGVWRISKTKAGNVMVDAALGIGAENSGKLVAKVKQEAKKIATEKGISLILVDGSPGIGCPVISSLSGADFVVLVTEPTLSGLHDLKRVYDLVKQFKISAGCIINKFDVNRSVSEQIRAFLKEEQIFHIASLPYNESFIHALTMGQTIVEYDHNELSHAVRESWNQVRQILNNDKK
jgi:MinD superfamily P-loop ATPase